MALRYQTLASSCIGLICRANLAHLMKKSWVVPIMMVMIFLISSSSGCLGLLQSREVMEDLRGPPDTRSEAIKYTHKHTFTTAEVQVHENTTTFEVDESVSEIVIYRSVDITASDIIVDIIGDCENITRYVRANLWAPNANSEVEQPVWSIDVCKNLPAATDVITPPFETGTWTLNIVARGGGFSGTVFQDKFEISATIKRTCIEYPLEDICT